MHYVLIVFAHLLYDKSFVTALYPLCDERMYSMALCFVAEVLGNLFCSANTLF